MKTIKKTRTWIFLIMFMGLTQLSFAQAPNIDEMPEYVIIATENTKLIGGIGLEIDWKKSPYKPQLIQLFDYLTEKKQNRVRTQIDLLNVMSELGFEYIDAFNSNAGSVGGNTDIGDSSELFASSSKFRVNIVFKKK